MLDLHDRFAPFFPIVGPASRLAVVPRANPSNDDVAWLRTQLFLYDEHDQSLQEIREQDVFMGDASLYDDLARVDEMLYAMQEVLRELLTLPVSTLEGLMPSDIIPRDLLRLKKAHTREDFARAMRARSRLGSLLTPT